MAKLEFRGKIYRAEAEVAAMLSEYGIPYELWGTRNAAGAPDSAVLSLFQAEIERLQSERGYQAVDLVALRPNTPNLSAICARYDQEHHHIDDEVRLTIEGEGVFEINISPDARLKFTAEPGDLLVIPAYRRHLFYLTDKRTIRCIRLFKNKEGWEAIYSPHDGR